MNNEIKSVQENTKSGELVERPFRPLDAMVRRTPMILNNFVFVAPIKKEMSCFFLNFKAKKQSSLSLRKPV